MAVATLSVFVWGTPLSAQARSHKKAVWKDTVAGAARSAIAESDRIEHVDITVTIVCFHAESCEFDIDNVVKPILDALNGIAFGNDNQVVQVLVRRTPLDGLTLAASDEALVAAVAEAQAMMQDFVYVRISDAPVSHEEVPG